MPSTTLSRGNILFEVVLGVQLTPAAVAGFQDSTQTFALPGALATDYVDVFPLTAQTRNMSIISCWISSARN